ncbi:MAG: alpha-L-fucosidase [Lachnospiraceae bacterium]|nr:alpha-L-fucosidase [Lachnospiraceae bacterium]
MWIENNYRRNLLDMHIDDWNEEFLSKIDPEEYVSCLEKAHVTAAMVKAMPHTGLCNYPTKLGRMHRGLKGRDFFGEVLKLCHEKGIAVIAYYSQVFDNYAYDNHPEWRTISADGKNHKEFRGLDCFRNGRYGIVCPNNSEYREYVKAHLIELNEMYDFEGMFLDMTFWPDVCYCPSCRRRYLEETGREMPKTMNWQDEEFRNFQHLRERWMADFATFTTGVIKSVKPECTVEHQMSMVASGWLHACSEYIADEVDYTGGDYYGGFLQQTFINKYYKNISPNLPFVYHTSRCDPQLSFHTTTKSRDELLLHVVTALVHNGAFLLVDAINPDGSIVPKVYTELMRSIYEETMPLESHINGQLNADVDIFFATHSKFDPNETNKSVCDKSFGPAFFMDASVKLASILREDNQAFTVIGSKNLKDSKARVMALCHVSQILDSEMEDIERYVAEGGNLYVSGPIGHEKLAQMIGVRFDGVCNMAQTVEDFTYIAPTEEGREILEGFDDAAPLSVPMRQYKVEVIEEARVKVLATITLPYTVPNSPEFAAIHSNPPGIKTDMPAMLLSQYKGGQIFYVAAPIEMSQPYMSRLVVKRIMDRLVGERSIYSDAPKWAETISWDKDGFKYVAVLNEQEEAPYVPVHDIHICVPGVYSCARVISGAEAGQTIKVGVQDGKTTACIPKVNVYCIIRFEK